MFVGQRASIFSSLLSVDDRYFLVAPHAESLGSRRVIGDVVFVPSRNKATGEGASRRLGHYKVGCAALKSHALFSAQGVGCVTEMFCLTSVSISSKATRHNSTRLAEFPANCQSVPTTVCVWTVAGSKRDRKRTHRVASPNLELNRDGYFCMVSETEILKRFQITGPSPCDSEIARSIR